MDDLAQLLASFDVSSLYPAIGKLSTAVVTYLSPVLLIISIYIRLMETQIDALVSGGKYGTAIRDILIWSFVLGSYFAIGDLIIGVFNPIYSWIEGFGSLGTIMKQFSAITAKQFASNAANPQSMTDSIMGVMASPYLLVSSIFYYGTLIMLAFLTAFLKICNVIVFGVAFTWGLIAVPVSISTTFKILRGWAYLLAFSLVWPIVQGLLLGLFTIIMSNSVDIAATSSNTMPIVQRANVMMLFAVLHLLMSAVMVAAPFITNMLVTNSSAVGGIVMPFVAAAVAAGAGTAKVLSETKTVGSSMGGNNMPNKGMSSGPQPRSIANSFTDSGGGSSGGPSDSNKSISTMADSGVTGGGKTTDTNTAGVQGSNDTKKKQQRRGVILNQRGKQKPGA